MQKNTASRNRTITLNGGSEMLSKNLIKLSQPIDINAVNNKIINQDIFQALDLLPEKFIDLAFIDPPYNLSKNFNQINFKALDDNDYEIWLDSWFSKIIRLLKPNASVYICGDWRSGSAIFRVLGKYLKIQNRISFEREKGRGAKRNWKNTSEDIWFATMNDNYYFDVESVKMKKKVIAPYKNKNGLAKDWKENDDGKFRFTYPSNVWTDITIPFWSMQENTEHPTQKPEKILAKIILASSKKGDMVFDPFLGSGTTAVVAKKLERNFVGIEIDKHYCCLATKRLIMAETNKTIQGYTNGFFWERNSGTDQKNKILKKQIIKEDLSESKEINIYEKQAIL
ncbi:MAG: DNA-methyltransferase [Alphaproteobacteria bacterium]